MGLRSRILQRGAESEPVDAEHGLDGEQALATDHDATLVSGEPLVDPAAPEPGISATSPEPLLEQQHDATAIHAPVDAPLEPLPPRAPGFRDRGRLRRRLRFLREVRELGFRDLGGLVFDQHRFQRPNPELITAKVLAVDAVDRELRAIEDVLVAQQPYSELFIAGVSACQRCGTLHGSDARFCPHCGLAFAGSRSISGLPGEAHGYPAGPSEPVAAAGQGALFAPAAAGDVPRAGVEQQVPGGDPQAP